MLKTISFTVLFLVVLARVPVASAQTHVIVDSNPQLFATLCALHAAGYEANVTDVGSHPIRARLRRELLPLEGPAVEELRKFYREHELAASAATLSRYVSYALVLGPPPKFDYTIRRELLPPDAFLLDGFQEVLAKFYSEAEIQNLWRRVQPEYEREIRRLQGPLAQIVVVATSYLREIISPASSRTFSLFVEPLVGGKTNFRNYGDQYIVVLNPARDLPLDEIRHAFLHFLLDPLPFRYPAAASAGKPLLNLAARAPRLSAAYRQDYFELLAECLVKAVELRLGNLSAPALAAALDEADRDGFVLVRPLVRQLEKFEQGAPAMSYYFPELMEGIDADAEIARLEKVQFAAAPAPPAQTTRESASAESSASELERWLAAGERQIAAHNAEAAAAAFDRVLARVPDQPRGLYGLAVANVLLGNAERAKELFRRLVGDPRQSPAAPRPSEAAGVVAPVPSDPRIRAWSHVYLGRIYDVEGKRELALSEYRAALAVEGAPEPARMAAQRGIERGYQPAASNRDPGKQP